MIVNRTLLSFAAWVFGFSAQASEITLLVEKGGTAIKIVGTIQKDLFKVEELVAEARVRKPANQITVYMDSQGGNHFEGMLIGLFLKRKGIGTAILPGSVCESACASIFFGGFNLKTGKPQRLVYEGGRLGVHRWRRANGREPTPQERDRVAGGAGWYLDQVSVSEAVQAKVSETPPAQIYYLTAQDMAGSAIAVKGSNTAPKW